MRILLVGDYPPDPRLGSAKVLYKLQEEYLRLGHTCDILLGDEIGESPTHRFLRWPAAPWLAARAVARKVRERGAYDVIDVASAEALGLCVRRHHIGAGNTAIVNRSNGLEHLNYARMLDDHRAGLVPKPWTRRLVYPAIRLTPVAIALRKSDRALMLNPADRDYVIAQGWKGEEDVDLVPHGVSSTFLGEYPAVARGDGLLFCGSWDRVKGIDYLAPAFVEIAERLPSAHLTILGPGVSAQQVLSCFPSALHGRIRVVPRTTETEVMQHYRTHDALLMPSTYEGFGMVTIEAMSQGLPVIATPVGCAPMLIENGVNGYIVPARDGHALADAAVALLSDGVAREHMGRLARGAVSQMSWTMTARRTLRTYEAAIAKRSRGSRVA
jgi:glycosyltransferase involved in cell wall biosynthesis